MPIPTIRRTHVDSSSIASLGYAPSAAIMEVEFIRGALYRYFDVPLSTFRDFLAASSKGAYFNAAVRDRFRCQRV
jgi:hypothetical protein